MSPPLFCSISHLVLLPYLFVSGWHWPCIMVSFHITPSQLLLQVPRTWPFPSTAQTEMLTLRVEIQLVRCAWLCWEEPWAWRGTWHTPAAPQGCSRKEALSPYKHHEQGTCPTCQCRWQAHVAVSAAPCAAGGEIWEVLGHCCEAARRLSVLLLGQWHQAKAEPMHKHLVQSGVVCICILWYFPDSPSIALSAGMPLELDLSACRRVRVFCTHFSLM